MEQLRGKDDEYMKSLKKQNDDIEDLIKSMRKQFLDMRTDYSEQLDQIEQHFAKERQDILARNDEHIKELFSMCRNKEETYAAEKRKMQEKNNKELEDQLRHVLIWEPLPYTMMMPYAACASRDSGFYSWNCQI